MGLMLLFGLLVGAGIIIGVIFGCWRNREGGWIIFFVGIIAAVALLLCSIIIPIGTGVALARMEAFYEANVQNYEVAADETASYLSTEAFQALLMAGSIEKIELADEVAARIVEWRDAVNQYNNKLASFTYYNQNLWVGTFYPTPPDYLKMLKITD